MTSSATYSVSHPPKTLCLLRLSALGDITHVLPTLRTLQQHWPQTEITWIIGKNEYPLVKDIENVNFIVFDKKAGWPGYIALGKSIRQHQGNRPFDVLLHMQLSLRASVASAFIPATIKLGFDKARAKDLQSVFCNRQIQPQTTRQHVLDSFLQFPRYFGLEPALKWQLPVSDAARQAISSQLGQDRKLLVINPCAVAKAKNWRNWTDAGYAAIADYAATRHNMQVALSGGGNPQEIQSAENIVSLCQQAQPLNLVGKTSLAELVALLDLADLVLAPDTGPLHIASALNTPVIGLYASTNPQRAGPYNFQHCVVNKYPQALLKYHNMNVADAPWGKRIKNDKAMGLITVQEVRQKIDDCITDREKHPQA